MLTQVKVIFIEDNRQIARSIKDQLATFASVEVAGTAKLGLQKIHETDHDVIILDLGLPDMSGLEVCRLLRNENISTPILILTGDDASASKVELLNAGADDYLIKPFNIAELKARITALSRRRDKIYNHSIIKVLDLTLDCIHKEATRGGIRIELRKKEFDILEYLVENKGRIVSREMIMNRVWDTGKESWGNTIDVHIKHLRDKLDKPFSIPLIKTAHGIGYMVDDDLGNLITRKDKK